MPSVTLDRIKLIKLAVSKLDMPYLLGAKWDKSDKGPIDCSGFVHWLYAQCGVTIPDGSYKQYVASSPISVPLPGDVGFFKDAKTGLIDHVGLVADDQNMIEARGNPYNKVILRPRAKWDAWPQFTGYRRFTCLLV